MTILFHVDPDNATQLWQFIGDNYIEKIIRPTIRSRIRTVGAQWNAHDFFSSNRSQIEQQIHHELVQSLSGKGLIVVDVLLGNATLIE